ncbi:MAG: hypothetical protein GY816_01270 [Cytophagales bacterium]|nr:hypothetical protein [Cytophagales bacterium]
MIILLIPVGAVIVNVFFGEQKTKVPIVASLEDCEIRKETHLLLTGNSNLKNHKYQLTRVYDKILERGVELDTVTGSCFADTLALLLIDGRSDLRGVYKVEQRDINRLFNELDVLLMIENYGKGVSR